MKHRYFLRSLLLVVGHAASAQTSLTFSPLNALPSGGRYGMAYCQDASAFYMAGGGSPASSFNQDVYRYEPTLDVWTPGLAVSFLASQRWATMVPATNGSGQALLYILSGATSTLGTPVSNMQTVLTSSGSIGPSYTNPVPAVSAAAAVWGNIIYTYGGQLASGSYTNQLRSYNAATDTWATLAPMPEAKVVYGGAAVNGKVYAIGGYNGVINSARVDAYDIASNTWQAVGTLPTTVSNQAVTVQGEWLWLVGDFNNQSYLAAYNTRTGQLRTFTSNLPPRRNAAAAVRNSQLYVWGGNTASANSSTLADMWVANVGAVLATAVAPAAPVLQAYPNPSTTGVSTLDFSSEIRTVEVLDVMGRQVMTQNVTAGTTSLQLDLQAKPAGIYLVRAYTVQGNSATCRLVRE
ncbi:T9SS type A sorting domain-containing protein [Hymenobacter rubidus]|uniref:T9SS type A sorting domain-containing protein n=1 Tax=Hymenobacter rubidus TaxID=1441626 RepID=UPI00191F70C3|nr:T9SS type A sorting domain-containing protein [Hymenobacter rubidus]